MILAVPSAVADGSPPVAEASPQGTGKALREPVQVRLRAHGRHLGIDRPGVEVVVLLHDAIGVLAALEAQLVRPVVQVDAAGPGSGEDHLRCEGWLPRLPIVAEPNRSLTQVRLSAGGERASRCADGRVLLD